MTAQIPVKIKRGIYNDSIIMFNKGFTIRRIIVILYHEYGKILGHNCLEWTKELCNDWVYRSIYDYLDKESKNCEDYV